MLAPIPPENCSTSFRNRLFNRTSLNSHPSNSASIHPWPHPSRCFRIAELHSLWQGSVSGWLEAEPLPTMLLRLRLLDLWVIESRVLPCGHIARSVRL